MNKIYGGMALLLAFLLLGSGVSYTAFADHDHDDHKKSAGITTGSEEALKIMANAIWK